MPGVPIVFRDLRFLIQGIPLRVSSLPDVIKDRAGDIRMRILPKSNPYEVNVLCRMAPERSYRPRAHSYAVLVHIIVGHGDFSLDGRTIRGYRPGDFFLIGPGKLHGFRWVEEETYFIKHAPDVRATRR